MFDYPQTRHVSVSLKVLIKCHQLFILVDCCYVVVVMLGLLHNTYLKGADCTGEKIWVWNQIPHVSTWV